MRKFSARQKLLLSSILSICLCVVVLGVATFAWLSSNKETTSNGMQLKVDVSPNLIIDDAVADLQAVVGPTSDNFSVTFSNTATALTPTTHDSTYATYASGLKYITNANIVDPETGLPSEGSLAFANAGATGYYVDFTVYIASTSKAMDNMDLAVSLTPAASIGGDGANKADTLAAASIDFYVGSVAQANYKGTLNVAGFDAAANDFTTEKTSVELVSNSSIPLNTSSYITVIMRCYVDGALLKSAGQAYINTAKVDLNDITLNATFVATDHSN